MYNIHMYIQIIFYLFGRCKENRRFVSPVIGFMPNPQEEYNLDRHMNMDLYINYELFVQHIYTYLQP